MALQATLKTPFTATTTLPLIDDAAFQMLTTFLYSHSGIRVEDNKKQLITSRLSRRLSQLQMSDFGEYVSYATGGRDPAELQVLMNLVTTNETFFFREPSHFDLLHHLASEHRSVEPFRLWSAAASTGEEAYSAAMTLEDALPRRWEILGSDINREVLQKAARGVYRNERIEGIPDAYLRRYCLRGRGTMKGQLRIDQPLRDRVRFRIANLVQPQSDLGLFHFVFLRNVLIYFDAESKNRAIKHIARQMHPGGYLVIGHAETLPALPEGLVKTEPTVYRKVTR